MNFRTTITLLLLVIVVGILYFLSQGTPGTLEVARDRGGSAAAGPGGGEPIFTAAELATSAVTRVVIQRFRSGKIVLEKRGQDWRQVEPVAFALSAWMGGQVVDRLATMKAVETIIPGQDDAPSLEQMGLTDPAATVTLQWPPDGEKAGGELLIRMGKRVGGMAYVQRGDRAAVHVVSGGQAYETAVTQAPDEWRRKTVQTPTEAQAQGVILTSTMGTVSLQRHDGRWYLDGQMRERASKDAITAMLSAARGAAIAEFVADAPPALSPYGLDAPAVVLTVTTAGTSANPTTPPEGGGKPDDAKAPAAAEEPPGVTTLRIGAATNLTRERFFAALTEGDAPVQVVFSVEASVLDALGKRVDDLRDPAISVLRASDVNAVTIEQSQAVVKVERGPSGWSFAEPGPGYDVEGGAVLDVINAVVDARATGFAPAPVMEGQGATPAAAVIRLGSLGGGEGDVIRLYPQGEEAWLAVRGSETIGQVLPRAALAQVLTPAIALRERVVWEVKAQALVGLRVERGGEVWDFVRSANPQAPAEAAGAAGEGGSSASATAGQWQLTGAERFDEEAVAALVAAVTPVRAEAWLVAAEDAAGGEAVQLTITTSDGTRRVLTVNKVTRKAQLDGVDAPFVADAGLSQALDAEFRYRTLVAGPVGDITAVTVDDGGGAAVRITRDSSGRYVGADVDDLSQAATGKLLDTLAGLRAARYVAQPAEWRALRTLTLSRVDGSTQVVAVGAGGVVRIGDPAAGAATWARVDEDARQGLTAALSVGGQPVDDAEMTK